MVKIKHDFRYPHCWVYCFRWAISNLYRSMGPSRGARQNVKCICLWYFLVKTTLSRGPPSKSFFQVSFWWFRATRVSHQAAIALYFAVATYNPNTRISMVTLALCQIIIHSRYLFWSFSSPPPSFLVNLVFFFQKFSLVARSFCKF